VSVTKFIIRKLIIKKFKQKKFVLQSEEAYLPYSPHEKKQVERYKTK
jgi:hypothetical protein